MTGVCILPPCSTSAVGGGWLRPRQRRLMVPAYLAGKKFSCCRVWVVAVDSLVPPVMPTWL